MKYRIGLDIGIASVGWCVTEVGANDEPVRIADIGVRAFDKAERDKSGITVATQRRQARSLRRLVRRRTHRTERVKALIENTFGKDVVHQLETNSPIDMVALRVDGLDRKLEKHELARLCVYFAKHRGFESSKKAGSKSKEEGVLLDATKSNQNKLINGNYRTIGEMLKKEYAREVGGRIEYVYRNKGGDYANTFLRSDLKDEIEKILKTQEEKGTINEEFAKKYLDIFSSQRKFDEGPGKGSPYKGEIVVGKCTFESDEERAPKASYTVEYGNALQKLNNLRVYNDGKVVEIPNENRQKIIEKIKTSKDITYAQIRKILGYDESAKLRFNLLNYSSKKSKVDNEKSDKELEKTKFVGMPKSYEIRKALSSEREINPEYIDKIAEIISKFKSKDNQEKELKKLDATLTNDEIEKIGVIDATKFAHLSLKAYRKLEEHLEKGDRYDEACEKAGYNHTGNANENKLKKLKGKEIKEIIDEINSPEVRRAYSQALKVINAIIDRYGSPVGVNVEVARELAKTYDERTQITKDNQERQKNNERIKQEIKEKFKLVRDVRGYDIVKYRLYEQQGGKCAYSGKDINLNELFTKSVEIDHAIPYSRSFDDSDKNKVLVLIKENQDKGNKTPYEYFGEGQRWEEFVARVQSFKFSKEKKMHITRKNFDDTASTEFKERNLNDTKYISRLLMNTLQQYLAFEESDSKKKVRAVSGGITSYLRKMWGLEKDRGESDKHHAQDAAVISVVTDGMIQKITEYNKRKESWLSKNSGQYVDENGVVISGENYDTLYSKPLKEKLKEPYAGYINELKIRLSDETEEQDEYGNVHRGIREVDKERLVEIGYTPEQAEQVKPIFVSRAPKRKANGGLHKDTRYSMKRMEYGVVTHRVSISDLKLEKGEIKDYDERSKEDDKRLYDALKKRLQEDKENNGDFYRPNPDGSNGPLVRKVKVQEKANGNYIETKNNKAYLKNETIVRTDVFFSGGKYYCVPIYVKDIASGKIPNKAIGANKDYSEWEEMKDEDFIFSLYKNDLIYVKNKKPFKLEKTNSIEKKTKEVSECYLYYRGIDSATGALTVHNHDNSYDGRVGIKMALMVKKYTVDMLGNISEVKREKRDILGKANK